MIPTVADMPAGSNPDANVVDGIRSRDVVHSPPECALGVIKLTEVAWRLAATGQLAEVEWTE